MKREAGDPLSRIPSKNCGDRLCLKSYDVSKGGGGLKVDIIMVNFDFPASLPEG